MIKDRKRKIYVIGHKNPDTDSICSAIAYAYLKREITGQRYEARRAGELNEETKYVLKRFDLKEPKLLTDIRTQVKDAELHDIEGVSPDTSSRAVWELMKKQNIKTIPVLEHGQLIGIVTAGDLVRSYMDDYDNYILSEARTSYRNIVETLHGNLITGDAEDCFSKGKISVGASSPEIMGEFIEAGDLVILGNRYESQSYAIDLKVSCIIVCQNAAVSPILIERANANHVVIIQTPYDTFTASRLINQSIPVNHFMTPQPLITLHLDDYLSDIRSNITKTKIREFPVLDRKGNLQGFLSRRRFMGACRKQVILVDHNERPQAIDGLEEADIIEIIDHHRLGGIETLSPLYFRNHPVGCTATIITKMFRELQVPIPDQIAGILLAAILSDTLIFRSPTCTDADRNAAEELAASAKIDITELGSAMFQAGSSYKGKTAQELCFQDFKQFKAGDFVVGVGQLTIMNMSEIQEAASLLKPYLTDVLDHLKLDKLYFMLTSLLDESSVILYAGNGSRELLLEAFDLNADTDPVLLQGVVSRKKQFVPILISALQQ